MKELLKLAWLNIWRNRLRSMVMIIAIVLGMIAGIFVMAFQTGIMNGRVDSVIRTETSHIQIHDKVYDQEDVGKVDYIIKDLEKTLDLLAADKRVKYYAPRTVVQSVIQSPYGGVTLNMNAVDIEKEKELIHLDESIIEGEYLQTVKKKTLPILMSKKNAEKLHLKLGSGPVVQFRDQKGEQISIKTKIVGIFKTNSGPYDQMNLFVDKATFDYILGEYIKGQELYEGKLPIQGAHEIAILVHNREEIDNVVESIQKADDTLLAESWVDLSPGMRFMIENMDIIQMIIVFVILLALVFAIVNTMLMAVLERIKELGMLMSIGMNKTRVFFLIVCESIYLAILGGAIGVACGYGLVQYFNETGIDLSAQMGDLTEFGMGNIVHPDLTTEKYVFIIQLILGLTFLASLYPAIKAVRLNPVKAVKG